MNQPPYDHAHAKMLRRMAFQNGELTDNASPDARNRPLRHLDERVKPKPSWLDAVAASGALFLILGQLFVAFAGRGAFGSDDLYGQGKIWVATVVWQLGFVAFSTRLIRTKTHLVALVALWTAWVTLTCLQLDVDGVPIFVLAVAEVLYCPSFFLFFYVLAKRQPLWISRITNLFFIPLMVTLYLFWKIIDYQSVALRTDTPALNDSYYALLLLPFVLMARKSVVKYGGLAIVAMIVFMSMKRTGAIALVGALSVYFTLEMFRIGYRSSWRVLLAVVAAFAVGSAVYVHVSRSSEGHLTSRFESMADDEGSGRLSIYSDTLALQEKASAIGWVLGHGHDGVRTAFGRRGFYPVSAHNDWQEVLYDYGIPGLLLYVAMHGLLLRLTFGFCRRRSPYGPAMAASYCIFLTMSLTSHLVLYATYFSYLMAFWGVATAVDEGEGWMQNLARQTGYRGTAWTA